MYTDLWRTGIAAACWQDSRSLDKWTTAKARQYSLGCHLCPSLKLDQLAMFQLTLCVCFFDGKLAHYSINHRQQQQQHIQDN
jgi:hypothetical protein